MTFRKVFSCLCLNSNLRNTIRSYISERFLITVALCATRSGVFSITRLLVHWYAHDSADALNQMRFRSLCRHGFIFFGRFSPSSVSAQQRLTILSMSCICGTSTVFSRILKLVLITAVGNVDRIVCSFVVVTSRKCVLF